jgi:IS30 family transposase
MSKHKHLTNSERQQIEHWLNERVSIKKIATYLGKSTSTITREIVKRAVVSNKKALYRIPNRCKHQGNAKIINMCVLNAILRFF